MIVARHSGSRAIVVTMGASASMKSLRSNVTDLDTRHQREEDHAQERALHATRGGSPVVGDGGFLSVAVAFAFDDEFVGGGLEAIDGGLGE